MPEELTPRRSLRGRFPFRLGTTSYIIPAEILPNAEFLAGLVDDIELVLFESQEVSNLPDDRTVAKLRELAEAKALSYTVHLPLDIRLGDADEAVRRRSVEKCLSTAERMRPLQPCAHVIHFDWDGRGGLPADLPGWRGRLSRSVGELLASGLQAGSLCVEALSYPFELVEPVVLERNLAVCMDLGHLLLAGHSPEAFLERHLERCRVAHLHGILNGRDHCDLAGLSDGLLSRLVARLASGAGARDRVVTIEVFSLADLEKSLAVMQGLSR